MEHPDCAVSVPLSTFVEQLGRVSLLLPKLDISLYKAADGN